MDALQGYWYAMDMTRKKLSRPHRDPKMFIRFLAIAIILMLVIDFVVFKDGRPYLFEESSTIPEVLPEPVLVKPPQGEYFEAPLENQVQIEEETDVIDYIFDLGVESGKPIPAVKRAKIAIVIDDMGMNLKQSRAAIDLPSEVTLAFLPYATQAENLSQQAQEEGHEVILHAPMEAMSTDVPLGSMAFTSDMDYARFTKEFERMISVFNGYVGVNNHMGSKLTQDKEHMAYLMDNLKERDMYFLDSRTIHTSVASEMARAYGVPTIDRDVFLDHLETPEYTAKALEKLEKIARTTGSAIAIGHPKEITMDALRNWIPTLESKGFELVKVSEIIHDKHQESAENAKSVSRETLGIIQ